MKGLGYLCCRSLVGVLLWMSSPIEAQDKRDFLLVNKVSKVALVIGNAAYADAPLRNTLNDANDMAAILRNLGFEVLTGTNLNRREMETKISEFGRLLKAGGVGLFYFSGHGTQVQGRNYLIPIGCTIGKEADVQFEAVDAGRILGEMDEAQNPLNILILDACRNNPFTRSFRTASRGLAQIEAPQGTLIAYATAPGSTASDNPDGRNGLFTQELLANVQKAGITVEEVFKRTRINVMTKSKRQQVPWDESSLVNDFYFIPPAPPVVAPLVADKPEANNPAVINPPVVNTPVITPLVSNQLVSNGTKLNSKINPKDGAEMVWVSAGEFLMGSSVADIVRVKAIQHAEGFEFETAWLLDEQPQRKVYLDGYWVYKNLVTVKQYRQFCAETKRQMPKEPEWGWQSDHPIVNVSWQDANAYCQWAGVQLPTEAQWEKAARGLDGWLYPWGNDWDASKLWSSADGKKSSTAPVGSRATGASPNGCLDMSGNVWQWCADRYDENYYQAAPARNPAGALTGPKRTLRGGAWHLDNPLYLHAAYRLSLAPDITYNNNGFRCAVGP